MSSDAIQLISCILTTVCGLGAIAAAIWTVRESQRPQPVVFLEHNRGRVCVLLVVQNFGSGVARDLSIQGFDYDCMVGENCKESVSNSFVGTGIPLLAPGACRDTIILAGPADMSGHETSECAVTLRYRERGFFGGNRWTTEEFVLDMGSFAGSLYSDSELHEIAKATKKMSDALARMTKCSNQ